MAEDIDPNAALFGGGEQKDPETEHIEKTFGRDPNRTSAIHNLIAEELFESIGRDPDLPPEAREDLIFKMTANSVLDMVMEAVDPETREEVCACLDYYIGMALVNKRFKVDLMQELFNALSSVKREEGESEEDFDRRLSDMEDYWWTIAQPKLDGRNPDDAVTEACRKYGLEG